MKVFAPDILCVPVVITPPFVSLAGDKFKTPLVIEAPFAFAVLPIAPTVILALEPAAPVAPVSPLAPATP